MAVGLAALLCAGCALGRSPSMAQAPLRLVFTNAGDLEVSLASEAGGEAAEALVGDFQSGVAGYDVVGGNALLPVRPPPIATPVVIASVTPGSLAASATLSGLASASAAASLAAPSPSALPTVSLAANLAAAGGPPVTATGSADVGGVATAAIAPVVASVAPPVQAALSPVLTVQGPVLDAAPAVTPAVAAATSLAGAAVNSLLGPLRRP